MRVGLTGASGFTGRHVEAAAAARGIQIVPLSLDLTDPASIDAAIRDTDFDRLIHLAAIAFVNGSDWRQFYGVNQIGSFALLEAVARHKPGARVLLASSAQVYGPGASGRISESAPVSPANHYAVSKYAMELGAQSWAGDLDITVVRPFNYTGVGQEARYLVPKIVEHFRDCRPRIELGNMQVERDFGDVRSVAEAYCGLILSDTRASPINICTGRGHTVRDIVSMLEQLTGHRIEVQVNPAFVRANDVPVLIGDNSRLQATLPDWSPRPLEETVRWMIQS